ncbi:MAG: MBL fold metallo-hydrolase [Vulcanimicrobiaceae bacterium]
MPLTPYVCENCGFWQRYFATPPTCPVCTDVRNDLPEDGWRFTTAATLAPRVTTTWREIVPGVFGFTTEPAVGLGGTGWLVRRDGGNIAYEAAGYYDMAALEFIASQGGLAFASTSHPHGCGALWQLQDRFAPELPLHRDGLAWSKAFRVTRPYDATLELAPGLTLHHIGGHYEGHALLHDADKGAVFCGDALKIEYDERGAPIALSAHKAYHKAIPLTPGELAHYRAVFAALDFDHVFTTFEYAPLARERVLAFFDELAAMRPSTQPLQL